MITRTEERLGLKPTRLAADTAYGSAPTLNWIVHEKEIAPHIPVIDKSVREDGIFSRDDFTFRCDVFAISSSGCYLEPSVWVQTFASPAPPNQTNGWTLGRRCWAAAARRSRLGLRLIRADTQAPYSRFAVTPRCG